MNIQLSDHFNYSRLLRFTLPSIGMMVITSIYGVVDGLFVSNIVGKSAFAAVNLMWPIIGLFGAVGLMIGTGGSALIAKKMGEGQMEKALRIFSLLVSSLMVFGAALAIAGVVMTKQIAIWLGAEGRLLEYCTVYGRILFALIPLFMLQLAFQTLMITAEKPKMGFLLSIGSGVANMVFDFLLIYVFSFGLAGAAVATTLGWIVGGLVPLIYFSRKNGSLLHFVHFSWDGPALLKACSNGISEMISNLSFSFLNILYNYQLMRFIGEDGVAAYGIIMYVAFVFAGVFMGYSVGVAPVVSFHYGAKNRLELQNLFKKSQLLLCVAACSMTGISEIIAPALAKCFVGYDAGLFDLAVYSLRIYSFCFLLCGLNMFASAFFTALNNGLVSGLISAIRFGIYEAGAVLLIPAIWGVDAIWYAATVSEVLAIVMNIIVYKLFNVRYHYIAEKG